MKSIRNLILLTCGMCVALGCQKSDTNYRSDSTRNELRQMARTANVLCKDGIDLSEMKSIREFLSAAQRALEFQEEKFETDAWGNQYEWSVTKLCDDSVRIRILSYGRNGRFDSGALDDLYVDVICQ
jgi:hypothetical protein